MQKRAFTLLELLISITIATILMTMVYAPYNYYTNKVKVKLTGKEISQILASSRNIAIHWADSSWSIDSFSWKNIDILVNFSSWANFVDVYSFAFDDTTSLFSTWTAISVKKYDLQQGMQINTDAKFRFDAITWSGSYSGDDNNKVIIDYSFKWSNDLAWKLTYYTLTNISDY